jgi:hypothetical protein
MDPCSGNEATTADQIEPLMVAEGIKPGERECHDAQSREHFRVDLIYPNAKPRPVALEISSITAGGDKAGPKITDAMMKRLSEVARAEGLWAWIVVVNTEKNLKELEPEILAILRDREARVELLRTGRDIWLGHYTADDLLAFGRESKQREFMALHERLRSMGLVSIKPVEGEANLLIAVLPVTSVREVVGFGRFLEAVVEDNADNLGETGPGYEHHHGVIVDRFDASDFPHLTPPPELQTPRSGDVFRAVPSVSRDVSRAGPAPVSRSSSSRGIAAVVRAGRVVSSTRHFLSGARS